jgi:hypothetical protein
VLRKKGVRSGGDDKYHHPRLSHASERGFGAAATTNMIIRGSLARPRAPNNDGSAAIFDRRPREKPTIQRTTRRARRPRRGRDITRGRHGLERGGGGAWPDRRRRAEARRARTRGHAFFVPRSSARRAASAPCSCSGRSGAVFGDAAASHAVRLVSRDSSNVVSCEDFFWRGAARIVAPDS